MRIIISAAFAALFLAACAGPAAPPDSFYRIEPGAPAQRFAKPALPGVLEVNRLAADGVVAERALAFARDGALAHYKYDFWSEPPGMLLQDRLAHYLAESGLADRVVTPELRVLSDWVLRGKVRRFEQVAGASQVAVELELAVVSARDGRLVLLQTYETRVATPTERVEDAARAMEKGVAEIFARFLADLGRADLGRAPK
ncbi:ABC-type transport auxiliary lipoprotein family protein [Magnetospirillum sp. XM-1]|uniref:ABC-type transport auxiliary lipoprotein family protein n=1 Tax=Magnetospirillum sp. XM-1 TaxID=1663591 RepID=UPI000837D0D7|nr:ABC-type transport auxiliary lipoprotein family protein [Magnetospirillum sp. XM-1]